MPPPGDLVRDAIHDARDEGVQAERDYVADGSVPLRNPYPTLSAQSPGNGPGRGLGLTQSPGSVSGATDEPQGREAAK